MIPHLPRRDPIANDVEQFLTALQQTDFTGEVRADFASRLLSATDNSIYQILPQAVLFPRRTADLVEIFQLANQPTFQHLTFAPRGGGTGTNGQSLATGIILDCSKYMNQIVAVDLEAGWVKVQPGVVLDRLNAYLKPHGVFFGPNLSPSSRATLGGMINTDACGKGSRIYGRTSDHILSLTWVLADGTVHTSQPLTLTELEQHKARSQPGDREGQIYRQLDAIVTAKQALIEQQFPKMPRFLTGYNLAKVYDPARQTFDLNRILAGSEGTLAAIAEATLKLTPIPRCKVLLVIHYDCFDRALQDSQSLLEFAPAAIETIDETILALARQDEIYEYVKDFLGQAQALNLVEFVAADWAQLQGMVEPLQQRLANDPAQLARGYYCARTGTEIEHLWELRKRGVGLLGNRPGPRKPIAFIEDTAVPPVNLVAYVRALKALLDSYGLDYAMFGHVDVGCLHVRPALNLQVPEDEALIRRISDRVVALVREYGGVMWAEHGRGFRSEYTPLFFGQELYDDLRRIKATFDPDNRLNPGKIVTPWGKEDEVVRLEAPLRGHFDRQVPTVMQADYAGAFSCNGNGACFNVNPDHVMCPSYQGSWERIHSPKGRASLLREWLRQLAGSETADFDRPAPVAVKFWHTLTKAWGQYDYSQEVYDALHGCLSCGACASQCPVHVDIPSLKAKFLQRYHTRYLRSPRDYLMGYIETLTQWQVQFPGLTNWVMQNPLMRGVLRLGLGLVDPPRVSPVTVAVGLGDRHAPEFNLEQLAQADRQRSVILLSDCFTTTYEAPLVLATYDLLTQLGLDVYVSPPIATGKPLQVMGFLDEFAAVVQRNRVYLERLQQFGMPMIGIEPSMVLTYRHEYAQVDGGSPLRIQLPQEFLLGQGDFPGGTLRERFGRFPWGNAPRLRSICLSRTVQHRTYKLLGHCTEKTLASAALHQWQQVFQLVGWSLEPVETGCCGMAGIYGFEAEHRETSQGIYQLSWGQHLPTMPEERSRSVSFAESVYLATGFSCRMQVQRLAGWRPLHPIQALQQALAAEAIVGQSAPSGSLFPNDR